jgi:hypothetical protein
MAAGMRGAGASIFGQFDQSMPKPQANSMCEVLLQLVPGCVRVKNEVPGLARRRPTLLTSRKHVNKP